MKIKIKYLFISMLVLPLLTYSQIVENIHFEQVGKQIHIYYDLDGNLDNYFIQVFCSTDNEQNWGSSLKYVTGDIGKGQKRGNRKRIIWDVLMEKDQLSGETRFKVEAIFVNFGFLSDDRDGQTYKSVLIGNQVWMAENLNYKTSNSFWYDNESANGDIYGRLYSWEEAVTACPDGWHLPTNNEWKILEMYLGMSQYEADQPGWRGTEEGKKLKSTSGWISGGTGTDSFGFSALPGGYQGTSRTFDGLGGKGFWWTATENGSLYAFYLYMCYNVDEVSRQIRTKEDVLSVRCIRN